MLRGDVARRPAVDPGLSGGLRAWLEDGVATIGERSESIRVTPNDLSCPWPDGGCHVNDSLALGALVGVAFRQFLSAGALSDPMSEGLAALACLGRRDIVGFIESMSGEAKAALAGELRRQLALMAERWPRLLPGWLPRTHERLTIPLGGGSVVLSGTLDLVLGAPSSGRASVCMVNVRSGEQQSWHRTALGFLALLETLRSGAAPFRLATYYSTTGELDVQDVSDQVLTEAVELTIDVVARLSAVEVVRAA